MDAGEDGETDDMIAEVVKPIPDWCWKGKKRRLHPDCKLFEEGNILCMLQEKQVVVDSQEISELLGETSCNSCRKIRCHVSHCTEVVDSIQSYERHYNSKHRNQCKICYQMFPTYNLLDIHLLESHDAMFSILAAKQNMYQCLLDSCCEKFKTPEERLEHLIKKHQYPANFRFGVRSRRRRQNKKKSNNKKQEKPSEMEVETKVDDGGGENKEEMDVSQAPTTSRFKFTYKVPKDISFGHGIQKGFSRRKKKHWHQSEQTGKHKPKDIDMKELTSVLEN